MTTISRVRSAATRPIIGRFAVSRSPAEPNTAISPLPRLPRVAPGCRAPSRANRRMRVVDDDRERLPGINALHPTGHRLDRFDPTRTCAGSRSNASPTPMAASALSTLKRPGDDWHVHVPSRHRDRRRRSARILADGQAPNSRRRIGSVQSDLAHRRRTGRNAVIDRDRVVGVQDRVLPQPLSGLWSGVAAPRRGVAWPSGTPRWCRWNSRCSWVTLVSTATSYATNARRSCARPCEVDSTTAKRSPAATMPRQVRPAGRATPGWSPARRCRGSAPPATTSIVADQPGRHARRPAASSGPGTRWSSCRPCR